jgi:hypothetical protein
MSDNVLAPPSPRKETPARILLPYMRVSTGDAGAVSGVRGTRSGSERQNRGMKRLLRILLNVTTAMSLLLFVVTMILWARSHWVNDHLWLSPRRGVHYDISSRPGLILISRSALTGRTSDIYSDSLDRGPGWSFESSALPKTRVSPFTPEGSHRAWQWLGFDHLAYVQNWPSYGLRTFRRIIFPMWSAALASALPSIPPLVRIVRRKKWRSAGACPTCGYDLRATPDRCPECGTIPRS